jgi:hypothetical protein
LKERVMVCEPTPESAKPAKRRYARDMAIAGAIYVALVFGGALAIRYLHPPQWALIVLALLPIAPALMMLRAYMVYVNALDEFQRRMQSEAMLIATAVVAFGTFAYGFLEDWAGFPHVSLLWVFPALSFVFGVARIVIRRRYR